SKYAEQILEAHKKRLLAQQSREERKQQKEREAEAGQFDDKEKFVTSAYKKQLAEMENFRLQEAVDNRLDELTAVEKQKIGMWKGGFYRTLLDDIVQDNNTPIKIEEKDIKQEPVKKSIHSDDSDEEPELNSAVSVNLKPGLNILKPQVKKPTKAEQIRRRFTPSPEHLEASSSNSDEELSKERKKRMERQHRRDHSHGREWKEKSIESHKEKKNSTRHHDKSREHRSAKEKEHKKSEEKQKIRKEENHESKKETMKEKTKEERLRIIKMILAHHNNSEKIEEIRQRYLERKKEKVVPLPL
ncbi:unnamed protein product, partial [Onchocerca ochengi]|uniref:NSRP1_N domain-containing protein n=1 Tax=Onchocerca ochengi TaxID=42157 RepID=A0A182EGZ8_ONCOC